MRIYLLPCLLTMALLAFGVYFLLWSSPTPESRRSEGVALDQEVMQYFSVVAEKYASEGKKP
jgi:hypothetical protein